MTTGTLSEFAKACGRSYKAVGYHYRAGHLTVVDYRRPIRVDIERSLEGLKRVPLPRESAGGARVKSAPKAPEIQARKPREDVDALLRQRLALRDEIIAQRLIEAPDLPARRRLWYQVPHAWQEAVLARFRELVTKQFGDDVWKRVSLIQQIRRISA